MPFAVLWASPLLPLMFLVGMLVVAWCWTKQCTRLVWPDGVWRGCAKPGEAV